MIKSRKHISGLNITQFQLGYFSIQMDDYVGNIDKKPQRTLLASNVYSIEKQNDIWIFDTGFSETLDIPFITPKLKYSFSEILDYYKKYHNVYIVLTHCHPDHIGGLIETFDQISDKNIKIFINKPKLIPEFYAQFNTVESFINEELYHYPFLFHIDRSDLISAEYIGGHTPEHSVLKVKNSSIYYPADLVPTEYHIKHIPIGEKNFDQNTFLSLRTQFLEQIQQKNNCLLLSHAPNDGIIIF